MRLYLNKKFDKCWIAARQNGDQGAKGEVAAIREILEQATGNDLFEYPAQSCLLFFRFPKRYRRHALDGGCIMFTGKKPTLMCKQPPLDPDKKAILRKKILKFTVKEYISPSALKINSLIKYFAVPKGIIDGAVQDWRIIFQAEANKLNDSVWAPSFALPTVNSLLQIVNSTMLMSDHDMNKLFLKFLLHPDTVRSMAIDLGPLKFTQKKASHWWMCWQCCLIGFKASPYNSIQMYIIVEEIIRGNRWD